jgi:tetratricopeptide (TPR) repeat protein
VKPELRLHRRRAIVLPLLGVALLSAACHGQPAANASLGQSVEADRITRPPLPDLSAMDASVQRQIRDEYAALSGLLGNGAAPRPERSAAFGAMGKLFMAAESYAEAEAYFHDARALSPEDARWPYYLGQLSRTQGRSTAASSDFETALALNASSSATLVWLGETYLEQGRSTEAEAVFVRAVALAPRVWAAHFGLGRAAFARGDAARAVSELTTALALDPRGTSVHYPLALAYRRTGNNAAADAHIRQRGSTEIGPPDPLMQEVAGLLRSPVVYEGRGDRAIARGDFRAAVEAFGKGLDMAPDSLSIRHKLATALSLSGDVRGAVTQFQEVLRRSPHFAPAEYSLALLLQANGQPDLAIEGFAAAARDDPSYIPAQLQLANALRARGRGEAALREYRTVIDRDPRIAEARFGYAASLVALRRYRDAREVLEYATANYGDRSQFALLLARLLAAAPDDEVRDGARAVALVRPLLEERASARVRETMAMALAETRQFEQAAMWQRDAISVAASSVPADTIAHMRDTLALYQQKRPSRTPWRNDLSWDDL